MIYIQCKKCGFFVDKDLGYCNKCKYIFDEKKYASFLKSKKEEIVVGQQLQQRAQKPVATIKSQEDGGRNEQGKFCPICGVNYIRINQSACGRCEEIVKNRALSQVNKERSKRKARREKCSNCIVFRRGDCFGQSTICEDFSYAHAFTKEETKFWPTEGDATRFRQKNWPWDNDDK